MCYCPYREYRRSESDCPPVCYNLKKPCPYYENDDVIESGKDIIHWATLVGKLEKSSKENTEAEFMRLNPGVAMMMRGR